MFKYAGVELKEVSRQYSRFNGHISFSVNGAITSALYRRGGPGFLVFIVSATRGSDFESSLIANPGMVGGDLVDVPRWPEEGVGEALCLIAGFALSVSCALVAFSISASYADFSLDQFMPSVLGIFSKGGENGLGGSLVLRKYALLRNFSFFLRRSSESLPGLLDIRCADTGGKEISEGNDE